MQTSSADTSTSNASIACQTEVTECCNVTTETDSDLQGIVADEASTVSNGLDDSYLRVSIYVVCMPNALNVLTVILHVCFYTVNIR